MSAKDITSKEDIRLDAFLRKEDELSQLLQMLEQPQPSAELDAAILAHAAAALSSQTAAANDPLFPGAAQRRQLPFFSRWKVPLSLAATILIALSVISIQRGGQPEALPQVALAPEAVAPKTEIKTPIPESISENTGRNGNADGMQAPAAKEKTSRRESPAAGRSTSVPAKESEKRTASSVKPIEEFVPNVVASANIPDADATVWRGSPPPAPAPTATAPREDAAAGKLLEPKDWLMRIEEKIAAGSRQAALDEWVKFRKAYPDYKVPAQFVEKIDALNQGGMK